jgi:hypothetical protein
MFETFYFILGVLNNILLIFIFAIRKNHLDLLRKVGWIYFFLSLPAIYGIFLVQQQNKDNRYTIFLIIFLAFLAIEALYDWVLKIDFREKMDWKLLIPYVFLYISMNYGFVVMVWKYDSMIRGVVTLSLFVIQIILNLISHPKSKLSE